MKAAHVLTIGALCFVLVTCKDGTTAPQVTPAQFGLAGTVVDSSGQKLDSVNIYCLYYTSSIPPQIGQGSHLIRVSAADTFGFRLYQNFPNPFSHSTFIRFALPRDAVVQLSFGDRADGSTRYSYEDTLEQGMYQFYLHRLVDSLRLRNGPYECLLKATAADGVSYRDTKEVFVLSDSGTPSARTNEHGNYLFEYRYAHVGDSVMWTSSGNNIYPIHLTNNVNLLFRRTGYRSEIIKANLFRNLLIRRDVVLIKEN